MNVIDNIIQWIAPHKETGMERLAKAIKNKQGMKLTAQLMQQTDSLTKKDIATWREAWQRAIHIDNPKRGMIYDIYRDCLVDLHLSGCIEQRKGKVLKKKFRLIDNQGKEDRDATQLLRKEWFADFVDLALDSRFWGHSLIQLGDIVADRDGYRQFERVELVPRKHVCPEFGVLLREMNDEPKNGIPYREGDIADWCVEVGKPKDLGLLMKCAPACISKKNMLAFWDMFGEIFGAPMRIARTTSQDSAEIKRVEQALETMGSIFWGVLPEGTDIEIKESSRGDAYNVYDKRVDRCNSEISKGVLMQTMTIDNGSSLSQSETHLEIFNDVIEADAGMIACVVNDKLLPIMEKHGFPVHGKRFEWDNTATFSPKEQMDMERTLLEHYEIDPDYFVEKYNIRITGTRNRETTAEDFFE